MKARPATKRGRAALERFTCVTAAEARTPGAGPLTSYLQRLNAYVRTRALTDSNRQDPGRDHVLLLIEAAELDPPLVGVVALGRRAAGGGWYIDTAAIDTAHQSSTLCDGARCADALLAAAFDHVRSHDAAAVRESDPNTTLVFAAVHRDNARARRVLERNGFTGFIDDPDLDDHLLAVRRIAVDPSDQNGG